MVLDKTTKLVWQRCIVGQMFDKVEGCVDEGKKFDFDEAQQLSQDGWRVPTVRELQTLRVCSSGFTKKMIDLQDGGETVPKYCEDEDNGIESMINTAAFPNTPKDIFGKREYWSSSPYVGDSDKAAWIVSFNPGDIFADFRFRSKWVRLVRASQSLGDAVALEFVTPLEKDAFAIVVKKSVEKHRIAKADEERRITQAKADEERYVAQAQAARASAIKKMVSEGAAQLYLKAGQAQRNWGGSIKVGGIHFGANFLYELIINKFPNSEYAIKANDQLNAQQR